VLFADTLAVARVVAPPPLTCTQLQLVHLVALGTLVRAGHPWSRWAPLVALGTLGRAGHPWPRWAPLAALGTLGRAGHPWPRWAPLFGYLGQCYWVSVTGYRLNTVPYLVLAESGHQGPHTPERRAGDGGLSGRRGDDYVPVHRSCAVALQCALQQRAAPPTQRRFLECAIRAVSGSW
jgi:hypothetical protein